MPRRGFNRHVTAAESPIVPADSVVGAVAGGVAPPILRRSSQLATRSYWRPKRRWSVMSEQESEAVAQEGADLEYDLAHEASVETNPVRSRSPEEREAVVTATPEYDGDYSYDLAHDVPPSR